MKNLSYEDILEDIKLTNTTTVAVKAITPVGFLLIQKSGKYLHLKDQDDKTLSSTLQVNQNGFNWLKREARGQHGWDFKLQWRVVNIASPSTNGCGGY